jgi:hypothetical protein
MDGTDWRGKLSQNLDLSDPAAARHLQLLEAINKNRWHSRNDTHVRCFSEAISSVSRSDAESRFYRAILTRIKFPGMPDRHESIPEAFQTTFQWIFNPSKISSQGERWDNFSTWLGRRKDSNVYWITGV